MKSIENEISFVDDMTAEITFSKKIQMFSKPIKN